MIPIMENGQVLLVWCILAILSVLVLLFDLSRNNTGIMPLMKAVWILTVIYSGPLGLMIYYYSGRRQIRNNSIWRKGFRSVAHCYSGCGAGELTGVLIVSGLLSLGNLWVSVMTFLLAYVFGFGMTMGPLMQSGMSTREAFKAALISDTVTIAVMEVVAISVDLYLSYNASIGDVLFWTSLILSLTIGLVAAYPVNVLLIRMGVKGGMGDPRQA